MDYVGRFWQTEMILYIHHPLKDTISQRRGRPRATASARRDSSEDIRQSYTRESLSRARRRRRCFLPPRSLLHPRLLPSFPAVAARAKNSKRNNSFRSRPKLQFSLISIPIRLISQSRLVDFSPLRISKLESRNETVVELLFSFCAACRTIERARVSPEKHARRRRRRRSRPFGRPSVRISPKLSLKLRPIARYLFRVPRVRDGSAPPRAVQRRGGGDAGAETTCIPYSPKPSGILRDGSPSWDDARLANLPCRPVSILELIKFFV